MDFFGTYGGHLCGFGGFLAAVAAVLYARACCAVRTKRTRPGLATGFRAEFRRSQIKKSGSEVAEQCKRARKSKCQANDRRSLYAAPDAAKWQRATDS